MQNYQALAFFSPTNEELARILEQDPEMRERKIEIAKEEIEPFMREYIYPFSTWPVFLSASRLEEMRNFVEKLPRILYKAMRSMFGESSAAFASYLNESPFIYDMLREPAFDFGQMINRHDVAYVDGQIKLIEVNSGCTVGGWQLGLIEQEFHKVLGEFSKTSSWKVRHTKVIDNMFTSLLAAIVRLKSRSASGNILVYVPDVDILVGHAFRSRYKHVVKKMGGDAFQDGDLFFFNNFDDIEYAKNGMVRFDGETMDAVMLTYPFGDIAPKADYLRLIGASLAGNIVMPDSVTYTVFGNKLLLALLHEPALAQYLSEEEQAFITRHIPYTTKLQSQNVQWRGQTHYLPELLSQQKDAFVIKRTHSMQGRDVFIGKFTSDAEWQQIVTEHSGDNYWLVQEYCNVELMHVTDLNGNLCDYTFVWGLFDTGNTYGGAFIRGMPRGKGNGVINSAQGALEFLVMEDAS